MGKFPCLHNSVPIFAFILLWLTKNTSQDYKYIHDIETRPASAIINRKFNAYHRESLHCWLPGDRELSLERVTSKQPTMEMESDVKQQQQSIAVGETI